jgi:electron transfer flavoprotein alpha subunit
MIVVIAEHRDRRVSSASLEAIAAASLMSSDVHVVLAGDDCGEAAAELSGLAISEVVRLEHPLLAPYTPDGMVTALAAWLPSIAATHVVLPHSYQTRDYAPRLAARLGRTCLTDCTGVTMRDGTAVFTRSMFQARITAEIMLEGPAPHIVSFQAGTHRADRVAQGQAPASIRVVAAQLTPADIRQAPEPPFREVSDTVDLTRAARIVAVGRGVKDASQLAIVQRLASALKAELGASRPACDAGVLPIDRQIGSSGQTVAPALYVAVGVSGAVQHVVGMKASGTVVVINKDREAPIFDVADYGLVGDLAEIVPALTDALEGR